MNIKDSVVFITGANRGLGLSIAKEAVKRGAKKVYAGMRNTEGFQVDGLTPIQIDVSNHQSVQQAAELCSDTTILVNNAGIALINQNPLDEDIALVTEKILATNLYGIISTTQLFSPALVKNKHSAIVNILSDVSWAPSTALAAYAISKAGAWSYTNSTRKWLSPSNVQVIGLHVGYIDTDLTRGLDVPKIAPQTVAEQLFDGVENNAFEVLVGEATQVLKQDLTAAIPSYVQLA